MQKLKYIHRNPVKRGLAREPQDWAWSSYRHYLTGEKGTVRTGSEMTFRQWEKQRMEPMFVRKPE
mgnify:FL=1